MVDGENAENTNAFWRIFTMTDKKRPTLDELLEGLDGPLIEVDWRLGDTADVQPELLAEVDPDEIGRDWDVESGDVPDEE